VKSFSAKHIFFEAWEITQKQKKSLFWFGFLPAFVSLLIGSILIYIQFILLTNSQLFSDDPKSFVDIFKPMIVWIFSELSIVWIIISILVILFAYFFVPVFSEGAIIAMVKQYKEEGKMDEGWVKGALHFLPLFEFSLIKNSLKPFSIMLEFLFALRMMGTTALIFLQPIFLMVLCFSLLFLFCCSYAPQFIVLKDLSAGASIGKSVKMAILFVRNTFSMLILFLLIELRVIFNVLVILLVPIMAVSIGGLFLHSIIGIFAEIFVALFLLVVASIISGSVLVLGNVAWTLAFLKLSERNEVNQQIQGE
jgi:hypothetical protein